MYHYFLYITNFRYIFRHVHIIVLLCVITPTLSTGKIDLPDPTSCNPPADPDNPEPSDTELTIPTLPNRYDMMIEVLVDNEGDPWSYELFDIIDGPELMGTLVTVNGSSVKTTFNEQTSEIYDMYDDDTCNVRKGSPEKNPLIFLDVSEMKVLPARTPFRSLLQFAAKDYAKYVRAHSTREHTVNQWTACLEWKSVEAKMTISYYFTPPGYKTEWGNKEVPIKVEIEGNTGNLDMKGVNKHSAFKHRYDILSAEFYEEVDRDDLQIPASMFCKRDSSINAIPELPDSFEMDVELSHPTLGKSILLQTSLRYDRDNQITETVRELPLTKSFSGDLTSHQDQSESVIIRRINWINDYNTGLQYVTEKNNNSCSVRRLPKSSISMSTGKALLGIAKGQKSEEDDFIDQGVTRFGEMQADSWGKETDEMIQKIFFITQKVGPTRKTRTTKATTQDGKNGVATFPVLVGMILKYKKSATENIDILPPFLIAQNLEIAQNGAETTNDDNYILDPRLLWTEGLDLKDDDINELEMSVYHYQPLHTNTDAYQVSQCYSPQQIARVIVTVRAFNKEHKLPNAATISIALRKSLAKAMRVSAVQISDLEPTYISKDNNDVAVVTFNLLGSPPVKEVTNKQPDISEIKNKLVSAISKGIEFQTEHPQPNTVVGVDKYLYAFDTSVHDFSVIKEASKGSHVLFGNRPIVSNDDVRYSDGIVALVAMVTIAATCGITLAVFYILVKKRFILI